MRQEGQEAWGDADSPEHLAAKLAEEWERSGALEEKAWEGGDLLRGLA